MCDQNTPTLVRLREWVVTGSLPLTSVLNWIHCIVFSLKQLAHIRCILQHVSSVSPHSGSVCSTLATLAESLLIFVELGSKGDKRSLRSDVKINLEQRNRDKKSETGNRRERRGRGKTRTGFGPGSSGRGVDVM